MSIKITDENGAVKYTNEPNINKVLFPNLTDAGSPVINVSGGTPVITAYPGVTYVCGEVSTLSIALPESGVIDVFFKSGSTATVLTITPPAGKTVKWSGAFDPEGIEKDAAYEISILNGEWGVAAVWL